MSEFGPILIYLGFSMLVSLLLVSILTNLFSDLPPTYTSRKTRKAKMQILSPVCTKLQRVNAHLDHRVAAHHFKVYICGSRNGIAILEKDKTLICLRNALHFLGSLIRKKGRFFLFHTNNVFIYEIMNSMASCIQGSQWKIGAFLTNSFSSQTPTSSRKKSINLGFHQKPDCVLILDADKKSSVIVEADRSTIPVVSLVDSTTPFKSYHRITYPIPANNSRQFVYSFSNLVTKTQQTSPKWRCYSTGGNTKLLMSIYWSRSFPRSNSSFLLSSGYASKSSVIRLREDKFLVDTGLCTPQICISDELTKVPQYRRTAARFSNKVGSSFNVVAGKSTIKRRRNYERFFNDLVAGEPLIKKRAAASLKDFVGPLDVAAGEPLVLPRRFIQNRARRELQQILRSHKKAKGFIIQKVFGGYSVAFVGFIAFLPLFIKQKGNRSKRRRRGSLWVRLTARRPWEIRS